MLSVALNYTIFTGLSDFDRTLNNNKITNPRAFPVLGAVTGSY